MDKINRIYRDTAVLKIKKASQEEDKLLIQAVNSIDDIDDSIAKLVERMRDWYTIYFPEMDTISSNDTYIKLIATCQDREEIMENHPESFDGEISYSAGADIEEADLVMVKSFAESIYSLQNSRKDLEKYIDAKMEEIAPNLRDLLGSTLGAPCNIPCKHNSDNGCRKGGIQAFENWRETSKARNHLPAPKCSRSEMVEQGKSS